jgi:ABC-2 type transport system ATP-binding protein
MVVKKVLYTQDLCKKYGNSEVLHNVNISVNEGEIYGLVGKNGAGKTTLMKLVLSLESISGGEVLLFDSKSADDNKKYYPRIGALIESPSFYPYLSANQNLEYYRIIRGLSPEDCNIDELLGSVGLGTVGRKKYKAFSLGMKQRLGIALALMGKPDLLILDEPINGLDPVGIKEIRDVLIRYNKEYGTTILVSSHILSELSQLATTYGFIHQGVLLEEISASDIAKKSNSYLSITVDDKERAKKILEEGLFCHDIFETDSGELRVYNCGAKTNIITRSLTENDIDVFSISEVHDSLEEYYLNLIGHGSADIFRREKEC